MSFDTSVRSSLRSSSPALGFWLTLNNAVIAKTILRSANSIKSGEFSWVLIDAEHGLISDRDYYELTNEIASEGASPIIRIPWSEEWMVKRALDSGAHGVMSPMCHSEEDAANIVKYSKYPPLGSRGYGPMFAPHEFPGIAPGEHYDTGVDSAAMVLMQIESRSGVENCEKIAQVNGVDVLFIGPFDLSKQMGVTRGGEEHEAAIQRVLGAAKSAGKKAAIFCTDGNDARKRVKQGFHMVSITTDVDVLGEGMTRHLAIVTEADHVQKYGVY